MGSFFIYGIPDIVKLTWTGFILILIPVYWKHYGLRNFLWFSDLALFIIGIALWLESSLLTSMMAVGVLLPELFWNIDYFGQLISRKKFIGLSDYMFDRDKPVFLRGLSLFHVAIPFMLIWMLLNFDYHQKAIIYQTIFCWLIISLVYFFTPPKENINWVFGPGNKPQQTIHKRYYFIFILLFFPIVIFLPTHLLLRWILG
jgi:hypothetical protein